jgi:hypothetical protein
MTYQQPDKNYNKRFKLWRMTLVVSLPIWMKSIPAWLYHPVATYKELQRMKRQAALEAKWDRLFSEAFASKKPEFEFDEKYPQRVLGLKETPKEASIPSVGVWSADIGDGALDRAIKSSGYKFPMEPTKDAGDLKHIVEYYENKK